MPGKTRHGNTNRSRAGRRTLLRWMASAALGAGGLSGLLARSLAAARVPLHPGVREIHGNVQINNRPAQLGQRVGPGDVVVTGKASKAILVVGRDAYLLRDETRFELHGRPATRDLRGEVQEAVVEVLRVVSGAALSVFGSGRKQIETPFVTIGIRGTAVYVQNEPTRSYVCTCYGETELVAQHDPSVRESIKTTHHESPRYVSGGTIMKIEKAPVVNHTDAELDMLEALVGRQTPFDPNAPDRY